MKFVVFFVTSLCIGLFSCNSSQTKSEDSPLEEGEHIYWVNSEKIPCTGVAPMECLQIQKSDTIAEGEWLSFYSNIEGFDFEPGFVYKLIVRETTLTRDQIPADASSIKYDLVKVVSKEEI